jgi:uncharacterized membrane protein
MFYSGLISKFFCKVDSVIYLFLEKPYSFVHFHHSVYLPFAKNFCVSLLLRCVLLIEVASA